MELYRRVKDGKVPWYLFYIGLTIELLIVIVDKSSYTNPIEGRLFQLTFLLFFLKLVLTDYSKKEWDMILALGAVAVLSYKVTGANDLIRVVVFVAACKNISLRQMMKYAFYVTLSGCMVIVMLAVTGIYGDMSLTQAYGRQDMGSTVYSGVEAARETRYTLGMGHPNALSCMFLMLIVMGVYVWSAKLKWYLYLFLMLLNVGVYWITGSKTSMLITTAFLAGACLLHYCRFLQKNMLVYLGGLLVFIVCIAFSVDAAACAQRVRDVQWNEFYYGQPMDNAHITTLSKIDRKLSGRVVSLAGTPDKEGMIHTWSVFSEPDNMGYYFDMGWVKLFYRYGIVPGILDLMVQLVFLWKLYKQRDACSLLVFTILTIYTVVEAHLISVYIGRNFMLMMMGYYLLPATVTREAEARSERLS